MFFNTDIKTFAFLKELGTSILEVLEPLQKYRRSLVSAFLSEKLALYSSQLCTSFEMLVQLAQEQHRLNAPIYVISYIFNICFFVYFILIASICTLEKCMYRLPRSIFVKECVLVAK